MLQTTIKFERGSRTIDVLVTDENGTNLLDGSGEFWAEEGCFACVDGYDNGLIEASGEVIDGRTGDPQTPDQHIDLANQIVAFLCQRDNETWDSPRDLINEAKKHPIRWL